MKRRLIFLSIAVVGTICLAVFLLRPTNPIITVENRARSPLTNFVLAGKGFSASLDEVAAASTHRFHVYPKGESGIRVGFDASGRHFEHENLSYIENRGRYHVDLVVETNFKVVVKNTTTGY